MKIICLMWWTQPKATALSKEREFNPHSQVCHTFVTCLKFTTDFETKGRAPCSHCSPENNIGTVTY